MAALLASMAAGCGDDDGGTNTGNDSGAIVCGNGQVELGEACDNGAQNSDSQPDACRTDCRTAYCGDGVTDTGETCDDSNAATGDGCDSSCEIESGWECTGTTCTPICGDNLVVGDETCDGSDLSGQDCVSIGQASGILACNTLCEWDITGCTGTAICGNGVQEGNETCDDGNLTPCDGCSATCAVEACGNGVLECDETCDDGDQDNFDDCPDGVNGTCRPAACGDGHIQSGAEVCDDGNNTDGDNCSADCQSSEVCGNGIIDSAVGEICDDGVNNSDAADAACRTNCLPKRCGDGIIDTGEVCDDGVNNSDTAPDACRTSCVDAGCGDGVIDTGEVCDDGVNNSDTAPDACRTTCVSASCGDSVIDTGEECDNGGSNSDTTPDACRTTCMSPSCGDSVIDTGEECDEGSGNSNLPDATCRTNCVAGGCGDGIIDTGEACEDGNSVDWDGCTACDITEFQVNTYTPNHQGGVGSDMAAAADGSFAVVWTSREQISTVGAEEIYGQRFDSNGLPAGGEFLINTHTNDRQYGTQIAMAGSGQFVVTWYCYDRSNYYMRLYASNGTPSTGEILIGQPVTGVAMADDGTFVVLYRANDSDGFGVYGQGYSVTGTTVGASFLVNTYEIGSQNPGEISMAGDGRFVAAWVSDGQDGESLGVYAQRYSSPGVKAGGEFRVNGTVAGNQYEHDVSMANDGSFVVTWRGGTEIMTTNIFARRYSALGVALGGEFQVNTFTTGLQWIPDVYLANDGSFVIAWTSSDQDGSLGGVYAQRYSNTGTAVGANFLMNVYTNDNQTYCIVDGGGGPGFAAAWKSTGQDGSYSGMFAQRYDASGNPLGH